jgi:hypothetical protein
MGQKKIDMAAMLRFTLTHIVFSCLESEVD